MQRYSDDKNEISPSTMALLQGVAQKYKGTLDSLMSFVHGRVYERDKIYTKGELQALTPKDVVYWMNLRLFGIADPPSDANHSLAQVTHLHMGKKQSLFYAKSFECLDFGSKRGKSYQKRRSQQPYQAGKEKGSSKARCCYKHQASDYG